MSRLSPDESFLSLARALASRLDDEVIALLDGDPGLAARPLAVGASREDAASHFLRPIAHYVYAGDTALHVAAAAHRPDLASVLVERGADVRHRNRRGAEPLHYAADGRPGSNTWNPRDQVDVIAYLASVGADPNAFDQSGVAPLHRAVRTRSSGAVEALVAAGADVRLMNRSGSTPLHLAVQNTGKSNSGSDAAKREQREIIALLLGFGARATDLDRKGKTVAEAATSEWVRELLRR